MIRAVLRITPWPYREAADNARARSTGSRGLLPDARESHRLLSVAPAGVPASQAASLLLVAMEVSRLGSCWLRRGASCESSCSGTLKLSIGHGRTAGTVSGYRGNVTRPSSKDSER